MHSETYPVTLAPRDEKPSLSSSKEKSLENVWLARKWKWKRRKKQTKALYILYIYISIYIYWITWCPENKLSRAIYKENYKTKYLKKRSKRVGHNYREASGEHQCTVQNGCEILAAKGWFRSCAKSSFSLEWSSCNGCISFVSTLNCALFEVLNCWLLELWNGI